VAVLPNKEEYIRLRQMHQFEWHLWSQGITMVAGVDEAGRGPLAGPVVAAAVILTGELLLPGLNDSKIVPRARRLVLRDEIINSVAAWGIGVAPVGCIERVNILQATFLAMRQAIERLSKTPEHLLIDGCWYLPGMGQAQTPIVKGDSRSAAIAAASILAKTTRDAIMDYYGLIYPEYDFHQNKGYPTRLHQAAIARYGPCFLHRRTFHGVKEYLPQIPL
jgi:ribonuclease HII